jgi:hypothetical protein
LLALFKSTKAAPSSDPRRAARCSLAAGQRAGNMKGASAAQLPIPAQTPQPSAALSDVAGGDLVLVGGKGCQNFGLLALRDLGKVQAPSEFCCDLIKFCG